MRLWFSGPRVGFVRPGIGFNLGGGARRASFAPSQSGGEFVYVIRGDHGHVKIGHSNDPPQRLRNLQTGSPFLLSIAWSSPITRHAQRIEQEAHAILDSRRLPGEWFAVTPEVAVAAIYAASDRLRLPLTGALDDIRQRRPLGALAWFLIFMALIFGGSWLMAHFPQP